MADPSLGQRVAALFRHSLTMAWAGLVGLGGSALALVPLLADLLQASGVKEAVQAILHPDFVPYYIIAISIVTALARMRTLKGE